MDKNAFPMVVPDISKDFGEVPGLTRRELFAAMAMQGLCAAMPDEEAKLVALMAVHQADALIEALTDLVYVRTPATPDPDQ